MRANRAGTSCFTRVASSASFASSKGSDKQYHDRDTAIEGVDGGVMSDNSIKVICGTLVSIVLYLSLFTDLMSSLAFASSSYQFIWV